MTEFVTETHERAMRQSCHHAMAKLSASYDRNNIRELYADMAPRSVTFHALACPIGENKSFTLTADEAKSFVEAWTQFQSNTLAWEMKEAERKEQEAEAKRQAEVETWTEIQALVETIPGIEIITGEDQQWDYDIDEYKMISMWEVKLPALGTLRTHMYEAEGVLEAVKDVIGMYNRHLSACEDSEKKNWYGERENAIKNSMEFLATHRAFVAEKENVGEIRGN